MKKTIAAFAACAAALGAPHAAGRQGVERIGEARPAAALQSASAVAAALRWAALPGGGQAAALVIRSEGAGALRAGIRVGDLPRDATLRVYAPGQAPVQEASGAAVLDALARNREAGERGPDARTWWSAVVAGDALVLEIELAPGTDPSSLAIAVPLVSHIRTWPQAVGNEGHALALVTSDGATRACEGALVAGAGATAARYFLTASRCAPTQSAASTLQAFWTGAASGVGARLLYASADSDTALLALDAPPSSAVPAARPAVASLDPALEQWLGSGAASRAPGELGAFSPR
jgi:hypothetical protein